MLNIYISGGIRNQLKPDITTNLPGLALRSQL